jgi:hypothetical protein
MSYKYTQDGSACETDHVWGTCVDLNPAQLSDYSTLAVESLKVA